MVKYITPYGFCYGVKNSLNKVREIKKARPQARIVFVRPLVHNEITNQLIYKETNATVYSPDIKQAKYRGAYLVFPAHGMTKFDRRFSESLQAKYVDCTCPVLLNTKKQIIKDLDSDKTVIFFGKKGHSESQFMCDIDERIVFVPTEDSENYDFSRLNDYKKISLYPQSTIKKDTLDKFVGRIREFYKGEFVPHPVCIECLRRWENGINIIPGTKDAFIIVTDPSSSNGMEFVNILKKHFILNNVYQIESRKDLKELKTKLNPRGNIYIGSATSAPNKVVESVGRDLKIWSLLMKFVPQFHGQK